MVAILLAQAQMSDTFQVRKWLKLGTGDFLHAYHILSPWDGRFLKKVKISATLLHIGHTWTFSSCLPLGEFSDRAPDETVCHRGATSEPGPDLDFGIWRPNPDPEIPKFLAQSRNRDRDPEILPIPIQNPEIFSIPIPNAKIFSFRDLKSQNFLNPDLKFRSFLYPLYTVFCES